MNIIRNKKLVVVAAAIFVLALGGALLGQEPPIHEVTFEAFFEKDPYVGGPWYGVITICIEGQEYQGTAVWQNYKSHGNKNGSHGFATATYDFPDLGSINIWESYKTSYDLVEPDHRKHGYSGTERITGGTGAFEEAIGVFNFEGYTEFWILSLDPFYARAEVSYSGRGVICGINLPE